MPRQRVVFCTCGGLFGALVLARLRACPDLEVCGIVRSSRVLEAKFGFLKGAVEQIRRSGVRYAVYLWCSTTLADWLSALGGLGAVPASGAAPRVLVTRNINDDAGRAFVTECGPDLLVSAFFNQRLSAATLALPKTAAVNIHPSLLPDAKGVDPVFQMLLHGAPRLGVTVHYMTPELDAGRILAQAPVTPAAVSSVFEATALAFRTGAELLVAALGRIAAGDPGQPQAGAGSYQSWPSAAEVSRLLAQGGALLRVRDLIANARGRLPR